jgi:hypothetical protein
MDFEPYGLKRSFGLRDFVQEPVVTTNNLPPISAGGNSDEHQSKYEFLEIATRH